jgi:hypothetical protein
MDDDSSVDTKDALMEMLGLEIGKDTSLNVQEDDETTNKERTSTFFSTNGSLIHLPSQCSKHHFHPDDCFALVIDDICTQDECQTIINMASHRFQYITEASHITPDGETYLVQIQNPNPHKLSVIDTMHSPKNPHEISNKDVQTKIMDKLYRKIQRILQSHPQYQRFLKRTQCGPMKGLNPRMRVLKYDASDNDRFEAHFDATTFVPRGLDGNNTRTRRQSLITVLLYLNNGDGDDFQGGETIYLDHCVSGLNDKRKPTRMDDNVAMVIPKIGEWMNESPPQCSVCF